VQPEPIEFSWAGEGARHTGNLVHRLLQQIAVVGLDDWECSGGIEARLNWCRGRLAQAGVRGRRADEVVERTAAAVNACLDSQRGRWILGPHPEARCEYPITATVEGRLRAMVLDRTFVDGGDRWIIDYKTSSHAGGDLSGFLDNEAERYREQLQRYRTAVALREDRPIRTALYFPLLDHFREI
jgi:ATP-dependent exoDNAse (exonuclease V) beta subunit